MTTELTFFTAPLQLHPIGGYKALYVHDSKTRMYLRVWPQREGKRCGASVALVVHGWDAEFSEYADTLADLVTAVEERIVHILDRDRQSRVAQIQVLDSLLA